MIKKTDLKKTVGIVLVLFFVVSGVSVIIPASVQQVDSAHDYLKTDQSTPPLNKIKNEHERFDDSLLKNKLDFKEMSLQADEIRIQGFNPRHHIGPFWFVLNPYEIELSLEINQGNVELIVDGEQIPVEPRAYIYLRGFFGFGLNPKMQFEESEYGSSLKGICTEVIVIPHEFYVDTIFEKQDLFDISDIFNSGKTMYGLDAADFNDDGKDDFAVSHGKSISLFYNNGNGFTSEEVFISEYSISHLDAADYDDDGDIDLLYTYSESENHMRIRGTGNILWNNGYNMFSNEYQLFQYGSDSPDGKNRINPKVTSADYDQDGDVDVLVGDNSGYVVFYENDDTGTFTNCSIISDFGFASWGLSSGDIDNDGDIDVIVSASPSKSSLSGYVYLKRNQFKESNGETIFSSDSGKPMFQYPSPTCSLQFLDYNNDDSLDIIAGIDRFVYLYENNNESFNQFNLGELPESEQGFNDGLFRGGITAGDFNSDDKDDLILGGIQGVIRLCLNNYGQLPPLLPSIDELSDGQYSIRSKDINGDSLFYFIDWGDGTDTGWFGPYESGETVYVEHPEISIGAYHIKIKVKDENGLETDWKEYVDIIYRL